MAMLNNLEGNIQTRFWHDQILKTTMFEHNPKPCLIPTTAGCLRGIHEMHCTAVPSWPISMTPYPILRVKGKASIIRNPMNVTVLELFCSGCISDFGFCYFKGQIQYLSGNHGDQMLMVLRGFRHELGGTGNIFIKPPSTHLKPARFSSRSSRPQKKSNSSLVTRIHNFPQQFHMFCTVSLIHVNPNCSLLSHVKIPCHHQSSGIFDHIKAPTETLGLPAEGSLLDTWVDN